MKRKRFIVLLLTSCLSITAFAQKISYKGTVTDEQGEPVIGATVLLKGGEKSAGVLTDLDGNFTIQADKGSTLQISYIGCETRDVAVAQNMKVVLKEAVTALNDVVVVGYGTQKKVNLSGSVASISGADIAAKPATDVLSALQGTMPGLAVLRSGGQPGSETSGMRIRGFSSTNTTNTLVLIDGVEGDMTLLNPNDIESVSVLKDAAACAIYGARAAAGVVLVTTKTGRTGKPTVSYNGFVGFNLPGNMPERLPAWEEIAMSNESRVNAYGSPEWNEEMSSWIGNPNYNYRPNMTNGRYDLFEATNWIAEGTKKLTTQQSHSVSVSGGSKEMNYLVSANYYAKNGLLKYGPDKSERYNLRVKLNSELSIHFNLGFMASYEGKFVEANPYGATSILGLLYRVRGRQPVFNPEGEINGQPYNGDLQNNPIDVMKNGGLDKNQYEAYTGRGELTMKNYIKGLQLKLSVSRKADYWSQNLSRRTLFWYGRDGKIRQRTNDPNSFTRQKNNSYHDTFEALLTYNLQLGKHGVDALAGSSYERYRKDGMAGTVKKLISNDFFTFNYYDSSDATNTSVSDGIETWAMMSYFGRLNYNYDERYLLEANVRYDGSSRLAPEKRWRAFPSFSAAWRVSEEPWFEVPEVSNLKLRASWGQLGNGAVLGLYDYIPTILSNKNITESNYYQGSMASRDKTWEIISTTNIGLDLGLLGNSLNITADYYWKKNDNMLSTLQLPHIIGISVPNANVGSMKTWGWELEVSYKNRVGDLSYQVSFNISDSQNKVTHYDGKSSVWAGTVNILEGYPLNTIWGYKTGGYWSSREEYLAYKEQNPGYQSFNDAKVSGGDIKYLAQGKPDHIIGQGGGTPEEPGDLVCLGNTNGRYLYGLNINLQWRGFDFAMMFQGVGKRKVLINAQDLAPFCRSYEMPWTIARDYWTPENTDAYWPRLYYGDAFNYNPSDRWIQDASYIRLKNIQLGYTIPLKKFKIDRLRVYVSGDDVWEHSKMLKVFDPEVGNTPNSSNTYPFFRTWTIGLNVTL